MFLRPKGCASEPNIAKLYSLRNVPVDLLHQVGGTVECDRVVTHIRLTE